MSVPFTQLVASTYDAVVKDRNKAANQWHESAFLNHLEKLGGVKRVPGGATLQLPLDYQINSGADFLATDTTTTSTTKTEVITAASYTFVPLVVPVNWTLSDEYLNSDTNQKIDIVSSLVDNAIASHDRSLETAFFAASATDGFESLRTMITEDGTGTFGTIVAGTETWWKNQFKDYDTGATLLADMATLYNSCAKGTGGSAPNLLVGGSTEQGLFEGKLTPLQRFETSTGDGGFKILKFKTADFVFSNASSNDSIFFINTNNTKLYVVQGAYRQRRDAIEHVNAAMMNMKIISLVQFATNNRSRVGVLFT
jgi:hypothetical protein